MTDIILETIQVMVLGAMLIYLLRAGAARVDLAHKGWRLIIGACLLLLAGSIVDLTDEFESLGAFYVIGNTPAEAVIEKLVCFVGGFIMLTVGLVRWIPTVSGVRKTERFSDELASANAQLERLTQHLAVQNTELSIEARIDALTGLLRRAAWEEVASLENMRCAESERMYAIIMIDVDHFKKFNDAAGHPAGDRCLRTVARCLRGCCRSGDTVGRYGGEEFVVLLSDTSPSAATAFAHRICDAMHEMGIPHPGLGDGAIVTVSLGVATGSTEPWRDAHARADVALYRAKAAGRDRVCFSSPQRAA